MPAARQRNHIIDFLFPIALFFVFAVSSVTVILLAANIYRQTAVDSSQNYTAQTSIAYLTEKIHQGDEAGGVSCGTFDGHTALILTETTDSASYVTYIYLSDGYLKELYMKEGADVDASSGKNILELGDFQIEAVQPGLYRITCEDTEGSQAASFVCTRSERSLS